jgi:hypothetical protein
MNLSSGTVSNDMNEFVLLHGLCQMPKTSHKLFFIKSITLEIFV